MNIYFAAICFWPFLIIRDHLFSDSYKGHGNSFHGSEDQSIKNYKMNIYFAAICFWPFLIIRDNLFSDSYKGHGNSFHGSGGRGSKKAQMRHCLRLMRRIVSTDNSVALQDFADQGAINQLIGTHRRLSRF